MQWITLHGSWIRGKKVTKDVTKTVGEICIWTILYIYQLVHFIHVKLLKDDSSIVFLVPRRYI